MSQFNSLSEDFRKSMEDFGDDLGKQRDAKLETGTEAMTKLAHAFVDGPVRRWYETLGKQSQAEVNRVLSELKEFSPDEIVDLMKSEGKATPMGFLDGFFAIVEEGSDPSRDKID